MDVGDFRVPSMKHLYNLVVRFGQTWTATMSREQVSAQRAKTPTFLSLDIIPFAQVG